MNRTAIREQTFRLIYSLEIQKQEDMQEAIELYLESNEISDSKVKEYMENVILGLQKNKVEIISLIQKNLKSDWKIERISKVDLAILQLAIYEIKFTDVPFKVAINEAVELAKKYGEDTSKNFVNGILASIVNE